MSSIIEVQEEIIKEFSVFTDWVDKYSYIIELGRNLEKMPEELKTEENLIRGCQSKVWLSAEYKNGKLYFKADSDALVTKGLISLLIKIFSGKTPKEILDSNLYFIEKIGLSNHLSPTRSNGLLAMIDKIKAYALIHSQSENKN